jgi:hypothetical protein
MPDPKQVLMAGLTAMELGANIVFPNRSLDEQFANFQQEAHQRRWQEAAELQQAFRSEPPAEIRFRE